MSITLVLAVSDNNVIGKDNKIPWRLPRDMERFKALTMDKIVVMGRKTWDSLPDRFKPLPGRTNVVLSNDPTYRAVSPNPPSGATTLMTIHDYTYILSAAKSLPVCIIGGAEIYKLFLPCADVVELTLVEGEVEGDTFFDLHKQPKFDELFERASGGITFRDFDKHSHAFTFKTFVRRRADEHSEVVKLRDSLTVRTMPKELLAAIANLPADSSLLVPGDLKLKDNLEM